MISGFTSVYIIWSLKQHCISALKSVVCVCLTISGDLICLDNVSSQSTEHIGCCAFACGDPARQTNQKHFQSLSSSKNGCMCSTSFIKNFRNHQKTKKTGEYNNWNYCRLSTARSKYNRKLCNSCVPWQLKSFNSRNSDFDCAGKQQKFFLHETTVWLPRIMDSSEIPNHHARLEVCSTRPAYREGRKPTAVKVRTACVCACNPRWSVN